MAIPISPELVKSVTVELKELKYAEPLQQKRYVEIIKYDLPEKASPNQLFAFSIQARVKQQPPYPLAGLGFGYVDGPKDSVIVTINGEEVTLQKGYGRYEVFLVEAGSIIGLGVFGKLSDAGKYTFQAFALYSYQQDSSVYFAVDDYVNKNLEITAPTVPSAEGGGFEQITKMLQEQLMPMMMSMMMLMMMMSMLSSMMASMREAFAKKE